MGKGLIKQLTQACSKYACFCLFVLLVCVQVPQTYTGFHVCIFCVERFEHTKQIKWRLNSEILKPARSSDSAAVLSGYHHVRGITAASFLATAF